MSHIPATLQNSSNFPGNPPPTIVVTVDDPEWQDAYQNWLKGNMPTNSKEWKKGVFCTFKQTDQGEEHEPNL